jgi:hypothetical protein
VLPKPQSLLHCHPWRQVKHDVTRHAIRIRIDPSIRQLHASFFSLFTPPSAKKSPFIPALPHKAELYR